MSTAAEMRQAAVDLEASGNVVMASLAHESASALEMREKLIEQIMNETGGVPVGIELKNRRSETYVLVAEEPDNTGRGRFSMFGEDGFTGHCVFASPAKALHEAVKEGYIHRADGALDRLAVTVKWKIGVQVTELVTRVNQGLMPMEEFYEATKAVRDQYESATA